MNLCICAGSVENLISTKILCAAQILKSINIKRISCAGLFPFNLPVVQMV